MKLSVNVHKHIGQLMTI